LQDIKVNVRGVGMLGWRGRAFVNVVMNFGLCASGDIFDIPSNTILKLIFFFLNIFIVPCIVIFYGMTNRCNNVQ